MARTVCCHAQAMNTAYRAVERLASHASWRLSSPIALNSRFSRPSPGWYIQIHTWPTTTRLMEIGTNRADFIMAANRLFAWSTMATVSPKAGGMIAPNSVQTSVMRIDLRTWLSVKASMKFSSPIHSLDWPSRLASVKLSRRAIAVGSATTAANSAMGGPMKRRAQRVVGFNDAASWCALAPCPLPRLGRGDPAAGGAGPPDGGPAPFGLAVRWGIAVH